MISPMMEETGAITGCTRGGIWAWTCPSRSPTCWRARQMSAPQSNSTKTMDRPTEETERTRVTPGRPFIAVSMGKETSCSASSGAMPSASVISTTVGLLRSGKTSTGMRVSVQAP